MLITGRDIGLRRLVGDEEAEGCLGGEEEGTAANTAEGRRLWAMLAWERERKRDTKDVDRWMD